MVVFALILLFFANHQSPAILFDTSGTSAARTATTSPVFLVGMFIALFVVYGFDTAGTFGEETLDAGRQAPRGILSAIWLSGIVGAIFLLAMILSFKDIDAAIAEGPGVRLPDRRHDQGEPDLRSLVGDHARRALPRSSSSSRSTSAPWRSRARRPG